MFLSTLSVMMPTLNEVLYDYNPYFHASKFCIGCAANIMQRGFGVVQRVINNQLNIVPIVNFRDGGRLGEGAGESSIMIGTLIPKS